MSGYSTDRQWSDRYIPTIKNIVGPHLVVASPFDIDTQQAADLIVLTARDLRIAARVRRAGYADRYPYEFTVRSKRDNGVTTELAKLISGWGDWMFYGHAADNETPAISRWWLVDLTVWRMKLMREGYKGSWRGLANEKDNGDGTHFFAFDLRKFGPSVLVASSHELPTACAA